MGKRDCRFDFIDWLCIAYCVLVALVFLANIVVHVIGPW